MRTTRQATRSPGEIAQTLEFEPLMRARVPGEVYQYVAGGANDESTLRRNVQAFEWITLLPRGAPLAAAAVDPSITLLGRRMPYPILVAPTSAQVDVHRDGERATYRAATAHGVTIGVSQFGLPISMIAPEANGHLWIQMYPEAPPSRVQEALAGKAEALILTVDSPFQPNGERLAQWARHHRPFKAVVRRTAAEWLHSLRGTPPPPRTSEPLYGLRPRYRASRAKLLTELVATAGLPVVAKGILAPEDAETAIKAGAAGIVVSNHGGRVLDGCSASIEALPAIVAQVAGRVPVLVDGGFRQGSDILKARALGADAVLIGRPVLWGLGAFGEAGVSRVLEILTTQLIEAMARHGVRSMDEVDRRLVRVDLP